MKLYVGNLSYNTTQDTLMQEFGAFGRVDEVAVITDRETGRPRGFAFVSMSNDNEGRAAIEALARDVRSVLLRVDPEVSVRELEAMIAGAVDGCLSQRERRGGALGLEGGANERIQEDDAQQQIDELIKYVREHRE